uniref:Reverse transcriptase zinc-binding domain-containing protein n=1 Tax=Nicotiana tabacum TaxID=4097 RepID=A0A1S3ZMD1_TOBAC|nr:PREDICTED: uncharacterized protein LOC107788539 [Nicotiana tabacum]
MIRQIYYLMLGQLPRVEWKLFMFGDEARAKAKFTMWLCFQDRMMTSDRLTRWGMQVDTLCVLCQSYDESRNHMFVECEFAKSIWKRILQWMQRQPYCANSWDQHWKWGVEHAKGKSRSATVFKMVYAETMHMIWNERNLRIFEKRSREVEELARNVACVCNVRASAQTRTLMQQLKL